ncbi:MAG: electron transfer flavoprotein subunit beta/FixA family protein [Thermoplasmata archaeon]
MPYNIVVCIKQIPDLEKLKFDANGNVTNTRELQKRIDDLSKNAIEEAVRIKEKHTGKITAICFGTEEASSAIKEAIAMGVDDGVIIKGYTGNMPKYTAKVLAEEIKKLPHDLVIVGSASSDTYSGELPGRLAAILNYPLLGNAVKVDLNGKSISINRVKEDYNITMSSNLPVVLSVEQEINQPRYPPVIKILQAGKRQIPVKAPSVQMDFQRQVQSITAASSKRKNIIFEDSSKAIPEIVKVIKGGAQ